MKQALIILAHGSRDPRWAEPFERLQQRVSQRAPAIDVRLAYLEAMKPDLPTAVADLVRDGASVIRVAPVFFGQGSHLREDLPALIGSVRIDHPGVAIACGVPAGEDEGVMDALAIYCIEGLGS